jgi:hypothetical protein
MWLLLMILLMPSSGIDRVTVLNTFATYEDCKPERDRIGFEMAERYPYENDFRIVCEFRDRKLPKEKEMVLLDRSFFRLDFDEPLFISLLTLD